MTEYFRERASASQFIKNVWESAFANDGELTVTADGTWDMVFSTLKGETTCIITGPTTQAVAYQYYAGQQALGIQFNEGTYMPGMPAREVINTSRVLTNNQKTFFIHDHEFLIPSFGTVEQFVQKLYELKLLARDVVVEKGLQDKVADMPKRPVQRHFNNTTGIPLSRHQQITRAKQAAALLQSGREIQDVVLACGYFDQAHLTRALKQFFGVTPQSLRKSH